MLFRSTSSKFKIGQVIHAQTTTQSQSTSTSYATTGFSASITPTSTSSKIFLMGMGHVKSGLIHRLKKYTDAVFLDVGSSIDAIAGIIDVNRPFFGDWTNYQINEPPLYEGVDFLQYDSSIGKHLVLERN